MQTNFELALKTIESLSDEDYERLWHWMQERMQGKITQRSQSNSGVSPPLNENGWQERAAKFREAMRWIDEHRQQYLGQWVCLDGNKLVSHGTDGKQVYADAKKQGIKIPFVEQVREEEKSPFWGGWD